MSDIVSIKTRSRMMSGIGEKNTHPELVVRSLLHGAGFRYRVHYKSLPGKPDLVLPKYRALILVNGCFWHGHECDLFKWPSTRPDFWRSKIHATQARDRENIAIYEASGWRSLVVWECAIKGRMRLANDELLLKISSWLKFGCKRASISAKSG